jgi:ABC-type multidrug transport system ATPase subunit
MPADSGALAIQGTALTPTGRGAVRACVGFVTANDRSLYWRLSGRENLLLYASLQGLRGRVARDRIPDLLHLVGLDEVGDRMCGELSTGMKQRLLIARALIPRPAILLLDEPTRSLDPITAHDFRAFIRAELMAKAECTVLVATHSDEEAFGFCDRVAFLDKGRVLATGTMSDLVGRFVESTYELLTDTPTHRVFSWLLEEQHVTGALAIATVGEGWARLRLDIPGGHERAAAVLNLVTAAGVRVGSFSRLPTSLAALMQRVQRLGREARSC